MYEARRWRDDPRFFAPTVTVGSHHYFVGDLVLVATDKETSAYSLAKIFRFLQMVSIILLHQIISVYYYYLMQQKVDGCLMAEVHKATEDLYLLDAHTALIPTSSILRHVDCLSRQDVMIRRTSNSLPQHLSDEVGYYTHESCSFIHD